MTEQTANAAFRASSFLQGHNADYIEQLHARYADNPNAVDDSWREFFAALADPAAEARAEAAGPSWARSDWPPAPGDDLTAALDGQWPARGGSGRRKAARQGRRNRTGHVGRTGAHRRCSNSIRALMIIRAYRIRGHLMADLDPLDLRPEDAPSRA